MAATVFAYLFLPLHLYPSWLNPLCQIYLKLGSVEDLAGTGAPVKRHWMAQPHSERWT